MFSFAWPAIALQLFNSFSCVHVLLCSLFKPSKPRCCRPKNRKEYYDVACSMQGLNDSLHARLDCQIWLEMSARWQQAQTKSNELKWYALNGLLDEGLELKRYVLLSSTWHVRTCTGNSHNDTDWNIVVFGSWFVCTGMTQTCTGNSHTMVMTRTLDVVLTRASDV